jgi:hypothetical protein
MFGYCKLQSMQLVSLPTSRLKNRATVVLVEPPPLRSITLPRLTVFLRILCSRGLRLLQ